MQLQGLKKCVCLHFMSTYHDVTHKWNYGGSLNSSWTNGPKI